MQFYPVESSNIASVGYEADTLGVVFRHGGEFHYEGVSEEVYLQLRDAESVGRAFHQLIKSNPTEYPHRKVA